MAEAWDVFKQSFGALFQFYSDTMKIPCSASSIELGVESGLVTYLLTRVVLRRPQSAFKYASTALIMVPAIYWPYCRYQEKKYLLESGVTVVDTQKEMEKQKSPEDKTKDEIKIDSA